MSLQTLRLPVMAGRRRLELPGVAGNSASTPSATANRITGDIDIRVRCAMSRWIPASAQCIMSKFVGGGGQWCWRFMLTTAGKLQVDFTTDGTNDLAGTSSVALPLLDGQVAWVRATLAFTANCAMNFYTAPGGPRTSAGVPTWSIVGTQQAVALASIFDSATTPLQVGIERVGTSMAIGKFLRAELYTGVNGTLAQAMDVSEAGNNAASWTSSTGEVWTIAATGTQQAKVRRFRG
jgi:hypothetical protein